MPKYLVENRGFTLAQMGMLAWLPFLTADLGAVAGGLLSGFLIKRNWAVLRARSAVMLPSAMLMPISIVIAFTPSSTQALVLICVVTFCHMAWKTNLVTVNNDIYPTGVVGSISGIVSLGSGVGGAVFTYLTGRIVGSFSYAAVFVIMGFLHPAAYLVYALLVRKTPAIRVRSDSRKGETCSCETT
jgi:ACS family hexuronate transporter-like MFS transporter